MKIVRIIARLNVGGPARHVVWLTGGLPSPEFESVLIAGTVPDGEEDMSYFAAENGVKPVYIPELSRELSPKDLVSLFKIYRVLRRERPDVVHTHTAKAGTVGRVAAFLYRWATWDTLIGRPRQLTVIHTFHGHVFHSYYGSLKTSVFLTIERLLARFATDRIITISEQQYSEIHERFGVGRTSQFRIVPLGIDLTVFGRDSGQRQAFRDSIGAGDDDIVVGFVGRLTEIKNLSLLLRVAEKVKVRSNQSPNIRFFLVGDGNLREQLESEAAALIADGTVTFLGHQHDIGDVLSGMDIIALTSRNEGTPLSLIEGMAAGLPFISTAVGGVVDLAGDQVERHDGFRVCERGVLVDADNVDSFTDGLIYLAKNEKLRERLSNAGREYIASNYSRERLVDDIASLYRDLGNDPRR